MPEPGVDLHGELRLDPVALRAVAVPLLDPPLGVLPVPAHVPLADRAVRAGDRVGPPDDPDDEVARLQAGIARGLDHPAERLVAQDQPLAAGRGPAVAARRRSRGRSRRRRWPSPRPGPGRPRPAARGRRPAGPSRLAWGSPSMLASARLPGGRDPLAADRCRSRRLLLISGRGERSSPIAARPRDGTARCTLSPAVRRPPEPLRLPARPRLAAGIPARPGTLGRASTPTGCSGAGGTSAGPCSAPAAGAATPAGRSGSTSPASAPTAPSGGPARRTRPTSAWRSPTPPPAPTSSTSTAATTPTRTVAKQWPARGDETPTEYRDSFVDNPFPTREWRYYLGEAPRRGRLRRPPARRPLGDHLHPRPGPPRPLARDLERPRPDRPRPGPGPAPRLPRLLRRRLPLDGLQGPLRPQPDPRPRRPLARLPGLSDPRPCRAGASCSGSRPDQIRRPSTATRAWLSARDAELIANEVPRSEGRSAMIKRGRIFEPNESSDPTLRAETGRGCPTRLGNRTGPSPIPGPLFTRSRSRTVVFLDSGASAPAGSADPRQDAAWPGFRRTRRMLGRQDPSGPAGLSEAHAPTRSRLVDLVSTQRPCPSRRRPSVSGERSASTWHGVRRRRSTDVNNSGRTSRPEPCRPDLLTDSVA